MKLIGLLVVASVLLAGCANYTEQKSPCVCNWDAINDQQQEESVA
ncbi:hypothetical protein [Roseobacter denitrificans]|nr:hypothetical protein [Roseobacter denitrificans]SFG40623.1 hypothetical protein SAMN05443635_11622 [Roseobacter denitrificans OCh 114]